jgi:ParB family transcriptional regulator, chromosome partitioning protein
VGAVLMELREVNIGELDLRLGRLRQIPEGAIRAMLGSIRSKGQLSPLVAGSEDGALVLIDGFVRQLAASRLGLESMLVEVVELSPVQMKAQLYLRNRERGMALVEECRLVRELSELDGLSQVEIGELLERHKSWVCRRLALQRDLSPQLIEDHALGWLGAGSVRRLAQLPPGNQEKLVAVARQHELSARQTGMFISLWQQAVDSEARAYVLSHPKEALARAEQGLREPLDPRLGEPGRRLMTGLQMLGEVSLRVEGRIRAGLGELPAEGVALIERAARRAEELCGTALGAVKGWLKPRSGGKR